MSAQLVDLLVLFRRDGSQRRSKLRVLAAKRGHLLQELYVHAWAWRLRRGRNSRGSFLRCRRRVSEVPGAEADRVGRSFLQHDPHYILESGEDVVLCEVRIGVALRRSALRGGGGRLVGLVDVTQGLRAERNRGLTSDVGGVRAGDRLQREVELLALACDANRSHGADEVQDLDLDAAAVVGAAGKPEGLVRIPHQGLLSGAAHTDGEDAVGIDAGCAQHHQLHPRKRQAAPRVARARNGARGPTIPDQRPPAAAWRRAGRP
mmetsp:Transcript_80823/g.233742  ORF Transcript_80823/g.233742 Transcript_80823/m.233742 type:complete len:262 (-) Transcript_80823:3-788(-)